jgi:crotonobetainyl-CoA:carnitine CoA-transferase CaiB-like acyl-CoA transferase
VTNKPALYAALEPTLGALSRDEVVRRLDAAAVPCGPIRPVDDALA